MIEFRIDNNAWQVENTRNIEFWHLKEWWRCTEYEFKINDIIYNDYNEAFKEAISKELMWELLKA